MRHITVAISFLALTCTGCLILDGTTPNQTPAPTATATPGPAPHGIFHGDLYVTGTYNNRIVVAGDAALVVASGDNRVEIVDLTTCTKEAGSCANTANAVYPQFSNPWNVSADTAGNFYTTLLFGGLGTGSVMPAAMTDGALGTEIVGNIGDFDAPQGSVVVGDKLYVGNTAFMCDLNGCSWGDAFVTVVDLTLGVVDSTIPLPFKNPFALQVFSDHIYVLCTGEFDDTFQPASAGGLAIIDPDTDTVTGQITIGVAAPGPSMAIVGNVAYIPSSRAVEMFKVNLDTATVIHGPQNPIVLSEEPGFSSYSTVGPDGLVYVASFLEDKVYALDPAESDKLVATIEVGPGGATPAGPIAIAPYAGQVLVLNTLANSLSTIELSSQNP